MSAFRCSTLLAFILFVSLPVAAQPAAEPPFSLAAKYWQCALFVRTSAIEEEEHNGRKYEVLLRDKETGETLPKNALKRGTAFLVRSGDQQIYLVTATHVAQQLTTETQLAFRNDRAQSKALFLRQLLADPAVVPWIHHPHQDVSILPVRLAPEQRPDLLPLALPREWLSPDVPPRFGTLTVCGYPMGLGAYKRISPVTSRFTVASEEIEVDQQQRGIEVKTVLLANPPAGAGYSGGPVFAANGEAVPRCVGLVSGSLGDTDGALFSAIIPARFILELLAEAAPAAR